MSETDPSDAELDPGQLGLGDMSPEGFRKAGRAVIDHIADYLENLESFRVLPDSKPGQIKTSLPSELAENPETMARILEDYRHLIEPHLTHWQHPNFLGYFAITGSGPGILGDALASAANINGMLWRTSPAATELEERTLSWLRQMMGLPSSFEGLITDTASISSLLAVAAARQRVPGLDVRRQGIFPRSKTSGTGELILYTSTQTHNSLDKAAILLGHGLDSVRKVPVDDDYRMDPAELTRTIAADRKAGHTPFCVVATAGTTSTTSIDPLASIAEICRVEGLWLHVDAAYGGSAAIVPELRFLFEGMELADSVVINPHKWLFVPMHLSVLYTRHLDLLEEAFSLVPEYLRSTDVAESEDRVRDYMNYGVQLGRRFRALKLWMVLRYFGKTGMQNRVREHVVIAQEIKTRIDDDPWFERLAPVPLSTVCFRCVPPELRRAEAGPDSGARDASLDKFNERLMNAVNATGRVFFSHTRLRGRFAIRLVVSSVRVTRDHLHEALDLVLDQARQLHANP